MGVLSELSRDLLYLTVKVEESSSNLRWMGSVEHTIVWGRIRQSPNYFPYLSTIGAVCGELYIEFTD